MLASFWRNLEFIRKMTRCEVVGRYKGSVMGPVFMLVVDTFVFSVVFQGTLVR